MLLLFLLVFNSATDLCNNSYDIREQTSQRLSVLSVVAWPSLLLARSNDPESALRCHPLLYQFRQQQRLVAAETFWDNGWFATVEDCDYLFRNYPMWKTVADLATKREHQWSAEFTFVDPDSSYWKYNNEFSMLVSSINHCKLVNGKNWGWPFRK